MLFTTNTLAARAYDTMDMFPSLTSNLLQRVNILSPISVLYLPFGISSVTPCSAFYVVMNTNRRYGYQSLPPVMPYRARQSVLKGKTSKSDPS